MASSVISQVVGSWVPKKVQFERAVAPQQIGIEDLLIGQQADREHRDQQDGDAERDPVVAAHAVAGCDIVVSNARLLTRQIALACQIDGEPDQHADARRAESPVPPDLFAQRSCDQRRDDHARVDREIINLEGVGAAEIVGFVERGDLAREIALEQAR